MKVGDWRIIINHAPSQRGGSVQALARAIMNNDQESPVVKTTSSSMGWQFGAQMILIFAVVKLFGLLGGLAA